MKKYILLLVTICFVQLTYSQYVFEQEKGTIELADGTIKNGYFNFKKGSKVKFCDTYKRDCEDISMENVKRVSIDLPEKQKEIIINNKLDLADYIVTYVPLSKMENGKKKLIMASLVFEGKTHDLYRVYGSNKDGGEITINYVTKKNSTTILEIFRYRKLKNLLKSYEKYFDVCNTFIKKSKKYPVQAVSKHSEIQYLECKD